MKNFLKKYWKVIGFGVLVFVAGGLAGAGYVKVQKMAADNLKLHKEITDCLNNKIEVAEYLNTMLETSTKTGDHVTWNVDFVSADHLTYDATIDVSTTCIGD